MFAPSSGAFDELLPGKVFVARPDGRLVKFVARAPRGGPLFPLPSIDPGAVTTTLRVLDAGGAGGDDTYSLNAGTWTALGNPPGSRGYRYRGAGSAADPCRVVVIKEKVVKAVCRDRGAGGVELAPPFSGAAGVVLSVDADRYCAEYGGAEIRNDENIVKRRDASSPTACSDGEPLDCGEVVYSESFDGPDGGAWPAPWAILGGTDLADLQGGRARFRPTDSGYSLARLGFPMLETDVEATFTTEFEDLDTQGVGFYVRQNGGHLDQTVPTGQGYAVFVEGFRGFHGIGVWREVDGIEQAILIDTGLALSNGVAYRVRFRVHQINAATTRLLARIWPAADPEPATWNVNTTDSSVELQGLSGGIAADSWSEIVSPGPITAHTFIDDVEVLRLCNPLAGIGSVETIAETFQFTEGPRWRADGTLLFTDIDADTIYRLTPPSAIEVFRTPSGEANGLASDVNGDLLACHHGTRNVTRTDGDGVVTTVVDEYLGMAFNSPNDLMVRSDGTLYFTDPHYGLADPGDREIPFNGLFRRTPAGVLSAEWMGAETDGPNGVVLSPDENTLYMANTATGAILAWDVALDGSLSNQRTFASGLFVPDGMCVDTLGNVYVATWANTVEIFDPAGTPWGNIAIPRAVSNCAFGGADARSLYVTAHEGLYRVGVSLPGVR
jgi:gluconolactonase